MRSYAFIVLSVVSTGVLVSGCSLSKLDSWNPFSGASKPRASAERIAPRRAPRSRPRRPARKARLDRSAPRARRSRSRYNPPVREAWRGMGEQACIAAGLVRPSPFVQQRASLGGPVGACGAYRPFQVTAFDNGRVRLTKAATLRCPMIPALERWTRDVVAPAAVRHLGSPIKRMRVLSSYSCRRIGGRRDGRLSEHGRANAIDIGAFETEDGRVITLKRGWRGQRAHAQFLRAVHRGACRHFTTVLGPNYNRAHHDHFHFDLARHGRTGTYRICK